jgi:uncharacterized Rmd1/YagE family protein
VSPTNRVPEGDLLNLDEGPESTKRSGDKRKTGFQKRPGSRRNSKVDGAEYEDSDDDFEEEEWVPDVFLFEFGTVVIWGMTEKEEKAFLRSLSVLQKRHSCPFACG